MKNIIKKINRILVRWMFVLTLGLARIIPRNVLYWFVDSVIMMALYRTNTRLVRTARRNIDIVFRDRKTPDQKQALLQESFQNLALVIAEIIYYRVRLNKIAGAMTIEGEQHLKDALKKKKGVVAITAHLGNFPFMVFWLAHRGYKVNVLMRPPRDRKMGKFISDNFAHVGGRMLFTVPERACVQKSIKALRANEVLVILIDQNYGADARIFVDFFGKQAATGASPVAFARRTGASVLPMFSVRKNGQTHIVVRPEIELKGSKNDVASIQENMQALTLVVEDFVRKYPDLWSWMHNRWKSKSTVSDKNVFQPDKQEVQAVNV